MGDFTAGYTGTGQMIAVADTGFDLGRVGDLHEDGFCISWVTRMAQPRRTRCRLCSWGQQTTHDRVSMDMRALRAQHQGPVSSARSWLIRTGPLPSRGHFYNCRLLRLRLGR